MASTSFIQCPPAPAHILLPAEFAFGLTNNPPVSAESDGHGGFKTPGISFEDFARMNSMQRKTTGGRRLATPTWAVNNKELRHLLVVFMEERVGLVTKKKPLIETKQDLTPEGLKARLKKAIEKELTRREGKRATMHRLNEEYVRVQHQVFISDVDRIRLRQLEIEIQGYDTYLRYTKNGGVDVVAGMVYLYYRSGMDSVGVASELGVKPQHVRQTLWRLHRVADRIAGITRVVIPLTNEATKLASAEKLRRRKERALHRTRTIAVAQNREEWQQVTKEVQARQRWGSDEKRQRRQARGSSR